MSCIWRLYNTLPARFVKNSLINYLDILYMFKDIPDIKFITFEEFLMHILNFAINEENCALTEEDAYKVIQEYESFIGAPLTIRHVFNFPHNGPIEDSKELVYFELSEEEALDKELNLGFFCELIQNKSDEKANSDLNIYNSVYKEILTEENTSKKGDDIDNILIKYFELIQKIRNKNFIIPYNIYLKNIDDEVIKKYEENLKKIKEEPEKLFDTYERKFNELNSNFIKWLFNIYGNEHKLQLNFNDDSKEVSSLIKKNKKTKKD